MLKQIVHKYTTTQIWHLTTNATQYHLQVEGLKLKLKEIEIENRNRIMIMILNRQYWYNKIK